MRITRPGAAPAAPAAPRRARARSAAIARRLDRYTALDCGHWTDADTIAAYQAWSPGRGKYWCEKCCQWRQAAKAPPPAPLPETPLF